MSIHFIKYVHIVSVSVAFALFFVRGLWVLRSYPSPQERWVRYLPYVVDAILAISALAILWQLRGLGWPGQWFTFKLLLVAVYVLLAMFALQLARRFYVKVVSWSAALLLYLFVTTVAVLHHPRGILSLL